MADITKRDYLKLTGVSLGAVALASGGLVVSNAGKALGTPAASTPTVPPAGAYAVPSADPTTGVEADLDGDAVSAEIDADADAQPQSSRPSSGDRLDFERDDDGNVEFTWEGVDFETNEGDRDVEFTVDEGGVALDFETDDRGESVELTVSVAGEYLDFEVDDGDDVEFESIGGFSAFEDDEGEVEYEGDRLRFEWDPDDRDLELVGEIRFEFDGDELEYRGTGIEIEWERGGEFEARLR